MSQGMQSPWQRTPDDLLAELVMASTNHSGPMVIVEGSTDERFLRLRTDPSVYFTIANGRSVCVALIHLLNSAPRPFYYLAIIDEDYHWLAPESADNLVLTDTRDLESMLMRTPALDAVLVELGDPELIGEFVRTTGSSIGDALLARAIFFGRLRTLGFIKGTVSLDAMKPARFARKDWTYDHDACADYCVQVGLAESREALLLHASQLTAPSEWNFARGHDLVDILLGGLLTRLGGRACNKPTLESLLRQSLQRADFEKTDLYRRVSAWETAHSCRIWKH